MKKFIIGFLLGATLFGTIGYAATSYVAEPATFKVLVNGEEFVSDPPALVVEGRTYLPLRAMGNALGVPVEWNAELGQAEVGLTVAQLGENQYSRTNPAPVNTEQIHQSKSEYAEENNYTVGMKVLETVRGEKAYEQLKKKSELYPEPDDEYEYMNVKIAFSVLSTKGEFSVTPSSSQFKVFTGNNEECPVNYYTSVDPVLDGALYEGGNMEGWITVMVKKDDANPKMAYGLDYRGAGGIWFALN